MQNYIIAARTAQGLDDWKRSSQSERIDAVRQWQAIQLELDKEKHQVKHSKVPPPCRFLKTRHMSFDERKKLAADKKKLKKDAEAEGPKKAEIDAAGLDIPLKHAHTYPQPLYRTSDHTDFEEAIQQSVAATSKGNSEEDAAIEKAIRASVLELQHTSENGDDEEELRRAVQASVAEANRARGDRSDAPRGHSEQLEAALHHSVQQQFDRKRTEIADVDFDDSGVDTDDDENIKAAIESSRRLQPSEHQNEELERALADSKKLHEEQAQGLNKAKTEEDIVIEYVKRQSLAEAAFKESAAAQGPRPGERSHKVEESERVA